MDACILHTHSSTEGIGGSGLRPKAQLRLKSVFNHLVAKLGCLDLLYGHRCRSFQESRVQLRGGGVEKEEAAQSKVKTKKQDIGPVTIRVGVEMSAGKGRSQLGLQPH